MVQKLTTYEAKLLARADLALSREAFERACAASREHARIAADALTEYGDHGPQISGVVRDHFPEHIKTALRHYAADVSLNCDIAADYRPARVRQATIHALGRAVAARDGSGFYGPRA